MVGWGGFGIGGFMVEREETDTGARTGVEARPPSTGLKPWRAPTLTVCSIAEVTHGTLASTRPDANFVNDIS